MQHDYISNLLCDESCAYEQNTLKLVLKPNFFNTQCAHGH